MLTNAHCLCSHRELCQWAGPEALDRIAGKHTFRHIYDGKAPHVRTHLPHGTARARWLARRPTLSTEMLLLLVCVYFTLLCNTQFWAALADERSAGWGTWSYLLAAGCALTGLHFLMLAPWLNRWTSRAWRRTDRRWVISDDTSSATDVMTASVSE